MVTLGQRVRALRAVVGISQREADRLAGLHQGLSWKVEEGRVDNPTRETLEAIARLYGVSIDWLCLGAGEPPSNDRVAISVAQARSVRSTEAAS